MQSLFVEEIFWNFWVHYTSINCEKDLINGIAERDKEIVLNLVIDKLFAVFD